MARISSSWVPQAQQTDALEAFWRTYHHQRIPCQPWVNLCTNHGATCLLVGAGGVGPLARTIAKQLIVAADLMSCIGDWTMLNIGFQVRAEVKEVLEVLDHLIF